HHHRQAGAPVHGTGLSGDAGGRRHVPRRRDRPAADLGRADRRADRHRARRGRRRRDRVGRGEAGDRDRHRRADRRHRRPAPEQARADGRAGEDPPRPGPHQPRRAARRAAGVQGSGRGHRAGDDQAGRHRTRRRAGRGGGALRPADPCDRRGRDDGRPAPVRRARADKRHRRRPWRHPRAGRLRPAGAVLRRQFPGPGGCRAADRRAVHADALDAETGRGAAAGARHPGDRGVRAGERRRAGAGQGEAAPRPADAADLRRAGDPVRRADDVFPRPALHPDEANDRLRPSRRDAGLR
ncbi:hypothetical protein LTR94_028267, partial [Friedmanniomyces endolithicus]